MIHQEALKSLADKLGREKSALEKNASKMISDFNNLITRFDFVKEKKTKLNKMPATMMLNADKSILIVFDNPEDSEKFYGK